MAPVTSILCLYIFIRDGHADIFGDAHRCICQIYRTCVPDNAEVDADIRMAIPNLCTNIHGCNLITEDSFCWLTFAHPYTYKQTFLYLVVFSHIFHRQKTMGPT